VKDLIGNGPLKKAKYLFLGLGLAPWMRDFIVFYQILVDAWHKKSASLLEAPSK
jgi:hypothetical protein